MDKNYFKLHFAEQRRFFDFLLTNRIFVVVTLSGNKIWTCVLHAATVVVVPLFVAAVIVLCATAGLLPITRSTSSTKTTSKLDWMTILVVVPVRAVFKTPVTDPCVTVTPEFCVMDWDVMDTVHSLAKPSPLKTFSCDDSIEGTVKKII